MSDFIPAKIAHADLIEATRPLLALLGVTADEIHDDLRIADGKVVFTLVARAEGDDSEHPAGVSVGTFREGDAREFAEFSSRIVVEVNG